jgi:hypothetical protein
MELLVCLSAVNNELRGSRFESLDESSCRQPPPPPLPQVPAPVAVWLFGSALLGLVGCGKRRKGA